MVSLWEARVGAGEKQPKGLHGDMEFRDPKWRQG